LRVLGGIPRFRKGEVFASHQSQASSRSHSWPRSGIWPFRSDCGVVAACGLLFAHQAPRSSHGYETSPMAAGRLVALLDHRTITGTPSPGAIHCRVPFHCRGLSAITAWLLRDRAFLRLSRPWFRAHQNPRRPNQGGRPALAGGQPAPFCR